MATIKGLIEDYQKEVNRYQTKADSYESADYKQILKEDRHVERRLCLSRAHAYRKMIADLELLQKSDYNRRKYLEENHKEDSKNSCFLTGFYAGLDSITGK